MILTTPYDCEALAVVLCGNCRDDNDMTKSAASSASEKPVDWLSRKAQERVAMERRLAVLRLLVVSLT